MSTACDLYCDQTETLSHVLRDYKTAQEFWAESTKLVEMHHSFGLEIMEWNRINARCLVPAMGKSYPWAQFFLFGIWHLWIHRNKRVFQPSHTSLNLCKLVKSQVYEFWLCVLDQAIPKSGAVVDVGWVKPSINWAKLNIDGSV